MGAKPKTVSLSDSTFLIAKKIEAHYISGFSGWLRAMIRQWDEKIDTVQLDLDYQASILRYKTLRAAVESCFPHVEGFSSDDVFARYIFLMEQKRLGDFE